MWSNGLKKLQTSIKNLKNATGSNFAEDFQQFRPVEISSFTEASLEPTAAANMCVG